MPPSAPAWQIAVPWQMSPGQQAMPTAPQFMQTFAPVPGGLAQPRPVLHVLPGQQFWPSPPQGWQDWPPSPAWHERPETHWLAAPLP